MTMKNKKILFHFFITIVFMVFLFHSIRQKKIDIVIYDIVVYVAISLGSYIRYKKQKKM